MSNIVYDATPRTQQNLGRYKPHANPEQFSSVWAVIDGDEGGGYQSAAEISSIGQPIGTQGRGYLKYEEFKGRGGKPHDIKVGRRTLREMICPRADADARNSLEAQESTQQVKMFLDANDLKSRMDQTGNVKLETTLSDKEETIHQDADPSPKK
jgi:hypothetical protein